MKLSKKTWHYRLVKYTLYNDSPSSLDRVSLCTYFWQVISSLYLGTFVWMWRSLGNGLKPLSFCVAVGVTSSLYGLIWFHTVVVFIVIPIVIGIGAFLSLVKAINERHQRTGEHCERLNLFSQYVKAEKQKICPIITWDDS